MRIVGVHKEYGRTPYFLLSFREKGLFYSYSDIFEWFRSVSVSLAVV